MSSFVNTELKNELKADEHSLFGRGTLLLLCKQISLDSWLGLITFQNLAGLFLSSSGRSLEKYLSFAWPKAEQYVLR